MDVDSVVSKIQKLLKLSHSDNVNEAAAAAKLAQELITKYEISQAMLADDEQTEDDEDVEDFSNKDAHLDQDSPFNLERWRERLAMAVSGVNHCQIYITNNRVHKKIQIVGRPYDVEKVRYLYQYFLKETNRLCDRDGKGCGKTWRNNFRHGVVDTLREALESAKAEVINEIKKETKESNNERALIKIDNALAKMEKKDTDVENFMKKLKLKNRSATPMSYDRGARDHGREAGKEIHLSKARGSLK